MEGFGALQVQTRDEVVQTATENAKRAFEQRQGDPVISNLASLLQTWWVAARDAKEPIQDKMLKALRQRRGEYEPDVLAAIQAAGGGQTIFMRLTDEKCSAAIAWLEEILLPPDDKPWATKPTPIPELPPSAALQIAAELTAQATSDYMMGLPVNPQEISADASMVEKQTLEAMTKAAREEEEQVEREIEDALIEAGWRDALREVLDDVVTFPCGILKGPLPVMEDTLVWTEQGPKLERKAIKKFVRVSPFDLYPSPMSRTIQDGYLIEKHQLARQDVKALDGVPGYDSEAIRAVLLEAKDGGLADWTTAEDDARQKLEGREDHDRDPEGRIEALQCWGWVQGKLLREWGMTVEQVPDETAEYSVEAWLIGRYVIKAELNGDLRGFRPYYKASFRERVGSFWGEGLPGVIADSQEACNAAARNLLGNMAISSGPQVGVDVSALAEGETPSNMYPWKIWPFDLESKTTPGAPVWFFQPDSVIDQLLKVYEFFSVEADNKCGIPRYAYGTQGQTQGALGTASGLSMMLNAATKGIKKVVGNLDTHIIAKSVQAQFFVMMVENPGKYRGDIKLVARGASGLLEKQQQQVRRNEFLGMVLNSEPVLGLIGMKGLAALLRAHVRDLSIDAEDVVPTPEEVQMQEMAQQQAAQQQMMQQEALVQEKMGVATSAPKKLDPAGNRMSGQDQQLMQKRLPITSDAQTTGPQ